MHVHPSAKALLQAKIDKSKYCYVLSKCMIVIRHMVHARNKWQASGLVIKHLQWWEENKKNKLSQAQNDILGQDIAYTHTWLLLDIIN